MSGGLGTTLVDSGVAERTAEAVLRAVGGRTVLLRTAADATASDAEQLGLAVPRFRNAPIGPAAFRRAGTSQTLLVSARSLRLTLGALGAASVKALFAAAVGVVVDGVVYRVSGVTAMGPVGSPYCWVLELLAPVG